MPKYRCQSCGAIWYGWKVFSICKYCGGKLEHIKEEKEAEI